MNNTKIISNLYYFIMLTLEKLGKDHSINVFLEEVYQRDKRTYNTILGELNG